MRDILLNLFKDVTVETGKGIGLFSIWHILYVILIVGSSFLGVYLLKNKSQETKKKVLDILALLVIIIYIADFFIQPFYTSDNSMIVDKLPFHICTSMGIMVCFVQFNKKLEYLKEPVTILGLTGALMYITYPGSAIAPDVAPYSYTIVQTFVFHGLLFAYGVISIATKNISLKLKEIWKPISLLAILFIWATFGNLSYSNSNSKYDWCFITGSTFPFIPSQLMPLVTLCAVSLVMFLVYCINIICLKFSNKNNQQIEK